MNAVVKYVDCQQVGSIEQTLFMSKTKTTHFETMITAANEVNSDRTKVPKLFIFGGVLLDCFTAELDKKTDSQSM